MQNQLYHIVQKLLLKSKRSFDKQELQLQIESHPSYPSLHAITGVLDHFGVENMAFDIPQTQEVYKELPNHFIAHIKLTQDEELVFVEKKENQVILTLPNNKKQKIYKSKFLEQWTGIVVVVEKEELAKQTVSTDRLKQIPIILLGLCIVFLFIQTHSFSLFTIIQLILASIGSYIGFLLVKHDLGLNSKTVEKLCTQSEKTSCDAVLNSKGANILGLFKLSDVTFVYFASLTFFWLVSSLVITSNNVIVVVSFLALPVVAYSIYYQASVVKKWCPLCLGTASILVAQIVVNWLNPLVLNFKLMDFVVPITIFTIISTIYAYGKSLISKNIKLSQQEFDFYKFKRNYSLFNALHTQKPILDTKIESIQEIIFGNPKVKTELLVITNPLCGYCKATHQALDKLLVNNNENLKVVIRFNINTTNTDDNIAYKIATALVNMYQKDYLLCKEAMFQIYTDSVDVTKWLKMYQSYIKPSQQIILETEKNWCINNNINFTPAVYLNQQEYPSAYDLNDLSLFIDEIKEDQGLIESVPETLEVETS